MKINEIGCAHTCPPLNWNKAYLELTTFVVNIDGHKILKFTDGIHNFYLIASDNGKLLAYIAIKNTNAEFNSLERIENLSKPKIGGLATIIVIALVAQGMKFVIKNSEELTFSGLTWLLKILKTNSELKITDQNGNVPSAKEIEDEWEESRVGKGMPTGPSSIFIEDGGINKIRLNESNEKWNKAGLLNPTYHYVGDKRIL